MIRYESKSEQIWSYPPELNSSWDSISIQDQQHIIKNNGVHVGIFPSSMTDQQKQRMGSLSSIGKSFTHVPEEHAVLCQHFPDTYYPFMDSIELLELDGFIHLTNAMTQFKHLKALKAEHCVLSSLPEGLNQLEELSILWLDRNYIRFLPDLSKCTKLFYLDLLYSPLEDFPYWIFHHPSLEKVLLTFNVGLVENWDDEKIIEGFLKMPCLHQLYLSLFVPKSLEKRMNVFWHRLLTTFKARASTENMDFRGDVAFYDDEQENYRMTKLLYDRYVQNYRDKSWYHRWYQNVQMKYQKKVHDGWIYEKHLSQINKIG